MKKIHNIYHHNDHRWAVIMRDPDRPSYMIDTNECLIISGQESILTDPGGMEIFPATFSAISTNYNPKDIKAIFASHQDPDIISSLSLWLEVNPDLKCYISWLWSTFVPHFGGNNETFLTIPDEGMTIKVGSIKLQCIPAHFLHSAGNFHLYDSRAKMYFSGDVGAALLDHKNADIYVKNFDEHIKSAEGFHKRWMGSNEARIDWCQRVSELDIDMMVPQHGSIYQGKDVKRFIDWFSELKVGLFVAVEKEITEDENKVSPSPESAEIIESAENITPEPEPENPDLIPGEISLYQDTSDLEALMDHNSGENKRNSFGGDQNENSQTSLFSRIRNFFKFGK